MLKFMAPAAVSLTDSGNFALYLIRTNYAYRTIRDRRIARRTYFTFLFSVQKKGQASQDPQKS